MWAHKGVPQIGVIKGVFATEVPQVVSPEEVMKVPKGCPPRRGTLSGEHQGGSLMEGRPRG